LGMFHILAKIRTAKRKFTLIATFAKNSIRFRQDRIPFESESSVGYDQDGCVKLEKETQRSLCRIANQRAC
jgi:hypothetical protein